MEPLALAALAAGVGYAIGGDGKPVVIDLSQLVGSPAIFTKKIPIDTSVARDGLTAFNEVGFRMLVKNPTTPTLPVYIRFNDKGAEEFELTAMKKFNFPFGCFYIRNEAGAGVLELEISTVPQVDISDWETLVSIYGSDIMVPMDVQGAYIQMPMDIQGALIQMPVDLQSSYIMMPVDIQAQYVTLEMDIVAQSLGNIAIDIAAQTVGNIDINLVASAVVLDMNVAASAIMMPVDIQAQYAALDIDIVAQTMGNLNIDIAAQTVGSLDINLVASAVVLDINLAASDITLNIDIAAQSVGDINIDIDAQSVGIYLQADWATLQGIDKNFRVGRLNVGAGDSGMGVGYTVPAGKTFYAVGMSVGSRASNVAERDLNQMAACFLKESIAPKYLQHAGGNGGAALIFSKMVAFVAGEQPMFFCRNDANHTCDITGCGWGFEL